jgi:hypothetical protein
MVDCREQEDRSSTGVVEERSPPNRPALLYGSPRFVGISATASSRMITVELIGSVTSEQSKTTYWSEIFQPYATLIVS